jgi:hypothetical protein
MKKRLLAFFALLLLAFVLSGNSVSSVEPPSQGVITADELLFPAALIALLAPAFAFLLAGKSD